MHLTTNPFHTTFQNSKIVLNSILIRRDIGNRALRDFNYQLDLMCNNFGVEFVEVNNCVGRRDLARDGTHLNREYQMLRCDRISNANDADGEEGGGGVAIYIKDGIQFEQHSFVNQLGPGIEAICVVLKLRGERLGLCVAYRPPI
ncbi:hypothetical protein J6590_104076, partial [Homalodisca vitripennis]